ncbi:MAG: LysM peptidoglycan-binding domain-containing protein, partial [Nitrospiraceae bacterium]|nr:LysM peptidoglycan-binding domain-containing protein [Nitrospiraceae bacterium]
MKKIAVSSFIIRLAVFLIAILLPVAALLAGEYTIKQGDTLWDISEERMKDPFLWKKLWKANPHIKNPDLIFPGQKLNIPGEAAEKKKEEIREEVGVVPKKAE